MSVDVDDVGALCVAHALADLGEARSKNFKHIGGLAGTETYYSPAKARLAMAFVLGDNGMNFTIFNDLVRESMKYWLYSFVDHNTELKRMISSPDVWALGVMSHWLIFGELPPDLRFLQGNKDGSALVRLAQMGSVTPRKFSSLKYPQFWAGFFAKHGETIEENNLDRWHTCLLDPGGGMCGEVGRRGSGVGD